MGLARWLYHDGRPNRVASVINRCWAAIHALGVAPNYLVTLEVQGRRSGRTISLPLVMVVIDGERYLVSMLGAEASWVRNVKAADGHAMLRHGRREEVRLEEVAVDQRALILTAYLQRAPGARAHLPIDDGFRGHGRPRIFETLSNFYCVPGHVSLSTTGRRQGVRLRHAARLY